MGHGVLCQIDHSVYERGLGEGEGGGGGVEFQIHVGGKSVIVDMY